MYPIQYKRDGEIFQVDGLQLKSKGGKPKGKIRSAFKWPSFDLIWPTKVLRSAMGISSNLGPRSILLKIFESIKVWKSQFHRTPDMMTPQNVRIWKQWKNNHFRLILWHLHWLPWTKECFWLACTTSSNLKNHLTSIDLLSQNLKRFSRIITSAITSWQSSSACSTIAFTSITTFIRHIWPHAKVF